MNYVLCMSMHVLLIDDHAYLPYYPMIVTLNILVAGDENGANARQTLRQ